MTHYAVSTLSEILLIICTINSILATPISTVETSRQDCNCGNTRKSTREEPQSFLPPLSFKTPGAAQKYAWFYYIIPVLGSYGRESFVKDDQRESGKEDFETDNPGMYLDRSDRRARANIQDNVSARNTGRNQQNVPKHKKRVGDIKKTNSRRSKEDATNESEVIDQLINKAIEVDDAEYNENVQASEVASNNNNNSNEEINNETYENQESITRNQKRNKKYNERPQLRPDQDYGFGSAGNQNYNNYGTNQILIQRRRSSQGLKASDKGASSSDDDQDVIIAKSLLEKLVQSLRRVGSRGSKLLDRGLNGIGSGIRNASQSEKLAERSNIPPFDNIQTRSTDSSLGILKPVTSLVGSLLPENIGISI